jgi:hypothetical protein
MRGEFGPSDAEMNFSVANDDSEAPSPEKREEKSNAQLKAHDIEVPDNNLEEASELLKKLGVNFEVIELSPRINTSKDTWIPGQYILRISDPEDSKKPASQEYMIEVGKYLKERGLTVAFGDVAVAKTVMNSVT